MSEKSSDMETNKDVVEEPVLRLARTTLALLDPTQVNVKDSLKCLLDSERNFLLAFCRQYYRRVIRPQNQAGAARQVLEKYHAFSGYATDLKIVEEIVTAVNATE